jgi:hypothetical protein
VRRVGELDPALAHDLASGAGDERGDDERGDDVELGVAGPRGEEGSYSPSGRISPDSVAT